MPFSTDLLDAKLAQQQTENEAQRQKLLATALVWLRGNAASYGIQEGYLFGSITMTGQFQSSSDIDLAIATLLDGHPFELMGMLSLQTQREVDLVPLDQCHFAAKIQQVGIKWTAAE